MRGATPRRDSSRPHGRPKPVGRSVRVTSHVPPAVATCQLFSGEIARGSHVEEDSLTLLTSLPSPPRSAAGAGQGNGRQQRWRVHFAAPTTGSGSTGSSFSAARRAERTTPRSALTKDNADVVLRQPRGRRPRTVNQIVAVSEGGPRAEERPRPSSRAGGVRSRAGRRPRCGVGRACRRVCRTGTHLFQFVAAADALRGWGRVYARPLVAGTPARRRTNSPTM